MSGLFLILLNMSISASVLIVVVVLARCLLRKSPKWIHCILWALVGIRLLCPFQLETTFSLAPNAQVVSIEAGAVTSQGLAEMTALDYTANRYLAKYYFEGITVPEQETAQNPMNLIASIWLCGVAVLLVYAAVSYVHIRRKVRESVRIEGNIYICDRIPPPFIFGVLNPRIYLPSSLKEVLIKSLQVGFFDQELYEKYKILTSSGIQKRFLLATYQRKETTIIPEYLINCANNSINCTINSINHSDNEQSKSKVKVNRKKRKEKENNKETSPNGEEKKDELSLSHSQKIDWVGLMNWYNSLFRDKLPAIKSMTETRKKAVKARIAQYGKESIRTVFNLVLQRTFLLGGNDRYWKREFDWIFKQANYTKILEGNYNGKRADTATTRRESVSRLKQLAGAILQGAESKKD